MNHFNEKITTAETTYKEKDQHIKMEDSKEDNPLLNPPKKKSNYVPFLIPKSFGWELSLIYIYFRFEREALATTAVY